MARVKRAVNAHKKRRVVLERASGYRGQRSRLYRKAKEQVAPLDDLRLPRPQGPQGRLPAAVDPAHQRRGPRNGITYNRFIQGLQGRRRRGRPQMLAELAVNDAAAFAALVEVAKKALPAT